MKSALKPLIAIALVCVAVIGAGLCALLTPPKTAKKVPAAIPTVSKPAKAPEKAVKTAPETKTQYPLRAVLGFSVENREIESFTFGNGKTRLVLAGGIHGGYEWNTVLLAYSFVDYLTLHPEIIPENLAITVIPAVNPDGVYKITGRAGRFGIGDVPDGSKEAGRLNAHNVDLNRNFDCNWKASGVWQNKTVSGGTAAFSEPESAAIRKFVLENKPAAVVFWHSQANAVYGSNCGGNMLPETREIMKAYSEASGYPALSTFGQYEVSGDATDWLASIGIPAMTAELKTHETVEWEQNLAGVKALLDHYGNKNN